MSNVSLYVSLLLLSSFYKTQIESSQLEQEANKSKRKYSTVQVRRIFLL